MSKLNPCQGTCTNKYTHVITGELPASMVAIHLIYRSVWYALTPLGDDEWEITVKPEHKFHLDACIRAVIA